MTKTKIRLRIRTPSEPPCIASTASLGHAASEQRILDNTPTIRTLYQFLHDLDQKMAGLGR